MQEFMMGIVMIILGILMIPLATSLRAKRKSTWVATIVLALFPLFALPGFVFAVHAVFVW